MLLFVVGVPVGVFGIRFFCAVPENPESGLLYAAIE